jgi:RecG-like helicase
VRVRGKVERVSVQRFSGRSTVRVRLVDSSGALQALYFNQPWMAKSFTVGEELELAGRVSSARVPALIAPRIGREGKPLAAGGALQLSYPQAEGIGAEFLGKLARAVLPKLGALLEEPLSQGRARAPARRRARAEHRAPARAGQRRGVRARAKARAPGEPARAAGGPVARGAGRRARRRRRARRSARASTRSCWRSSRSPSRQARRRSRASCGRTSLRRPMRRLLQGDVGCGKTALGLYAALTRRAPAGRSPSCRAGPRSSASSTTTA